MKHGDFTLLANAYINRPGYSLEVLDVIATYVKKKLDVTALRVADVGAGTGKLTENLCDLGLTGYAIEPNDAMRLEGMKHLEGKPFEWLAGAAEETGLQGQCVDWVLMGSSFHWTDEPVALKEFSRILRPSGFFTAIWNPRDIEKNELHLEIENEIHKIVPKIKRVSSGSSKNLQDMERRIVCNRHFKNVFFVEAPFTVSMTRERYIGAWLSVNDIRVQAGDENFAQIISMIERKTAGMNIIDVPYKARAWTAQAVSDNSRE